MTGYGAPDSLRGRVETGWREVSRYQELPAADKVDALVRATEIFADVYEAAPELVPEPLSAACAAICATRAGLPTDHIALHDEALDLLGEGERSHDLGTVDQAVWRLAVAALAARDHPLLSGYLSHLGTAWVDRFWLTGRAADLDHAVARHEEALALPPTEPADRAGFRANYSSALRTRYEATGDARDLDRALALAREAVRRAPDPGAAALGRADRFALSTSLQSLTAALAARFKLDRDEAGLDEAIATARRAVAVTGRSSPEYATVQALLANALLDRFARYWDESDLDDAVAAAAAGVTAAAGSRARAVALSALALAQSNQFKHTGDVRYGNQAVATGHDSVAATGGDPVGAAVCLSNLGGILATRYQLAGDASDLDRAVEAHRRAVAVVPGRYVNKPAFLSGLGNTLRSRFQVGGDLADISEATEVLGQAVATAPAAWLDRPGFVANLAEALIAAAERQEDPATLGRAAAIVRDELSTLARDHPLRHLCLAAAGHAWLTVYDLTGDPDALRQATGHWEQAAAAVSAGHPQRADYLTALGAAWLREFDRSRQADRAAGAAAAAASRSAAGTGTAPVLTRALAARNWAEAAAGLGDAQEAAAGFAAAVDLLDRVAWHGLRRGDQERRLGRFTGLAGAAAAWAIEAGRPEQAVELLEQGRGVLLAQALTDRARRHDLLRDAPRLAAELDEADDRLEAVTAAEDLVPAAEAGPAWREGLLRQREEVLASIRAIPGYTDFLRAPRFADISQAAGPGPVVIVNVSKYRCDALIVTTDGVRVVPLGGLTGDDVVRQAAAFLGALDLLSRDGDDPGKRRTAAETVTATLRWLWEAIASPLLPALLAACAGGATAATGPGAPRPRVWWCPTGPLTFLPLHAAGVHDGGGDAVLDHVVSSYALTLRSLLHAQRRPPGAAGAAPVVVALPDTPGQSPLSGADEEARVVARRFPGTRQVRGTAATLTEVRTILAGSPRLAHFACHGVQDVTDPSSGRLALHDGELRVPDVAGMRLDAAELAFLSACETARGGFDLVDEVITVAAAFHLAGYRHVVGTLWSISDGLAPDVARRVYAALAGGTSDLDAGGTAAALDAAVRAHRTGPAWLWAPYIHLGP